jgi:hypothetical protein
MERGFVLILTSVAYLVGLPLLAMTGGDGGPGFVALALVGLGSIGLLVFIVATGVVMGMREFREERESEPTR